MIETEEKIQLKFTSNVSVQSFRCTICCKVFRSLKEAKMHIDYVHFELYQYHCKICNSIFIRLKTARSHFYKRHNNRTISEFLMNYPSDEAYKYIVSCHLPPDPPEQDLDKTSSGGMTQLKIITAPVVTLKMEPTDSEARLERKTKCSGSTTNQAQPKIEPSSSQSPLSLEPQTEIRSGDVIKPSEPPTKKAKVQDSIPCQGCGKSFKTDSSLQTHQKKFCSEREKSPQDPRIEESVKKLNKDDPEFSAKTKFLCLICKKAFLSKAVTRTHVATVHLKLTPFSCQTCGKKFTQKPAMVKHQQKLHPGQEGAQQVTQDAQVAPQQDEDESMCEVCGQVFSSINQLTEHLQLQHQG